MDKIYPSMVIRSQADALELQADTIELLEIELEQLKEKEKNIKITNKKLRVENKELKEKINNIKKIIIDNSYNELYEWFNELREERVIEIVNILDIKKDIEKKRGEKNG